jgi:hypothetical protein
VGDDELLASVIDPSQIAWDLARLKVGSDLPL